MVTTHIKTVNLSDIKLNPDNPRTISKKNMARLVKSLEEFPDMLTLREIVVDETMTVLGGNMRLLALKQTGAKGCTVKIVSGLTPEQKREFVIKDNAAFGEWDMDALANSWGDLPLAEWGIDVPALWTLDQTPEESESQGILRKNFMDGKETSERETQEHETQEHIEGGKYPVTFVLSEDEWSLWESVKEQMATKNDKTAFLKIIGGYNA